MHLRTLLIFSYVKLHFYVSIPDEVSEHSHSIAKYTLIYKLYFRFISFVRKKTCFFLQRKEHFFFFQQVNKPAKCNKAPTKTTKLRNIESGGRKSYQTWGSIKSLVYSRVNRPKSQFFPFFAAKTGQRKRMKNGGWTYSYNRMYRRKTT